MTIITRSVTMPEELMTEIDEVARQMYTNRSQLLIRVWQEWRQFRIQDQRPLSITFRGSSSGDKAA